MRDWAQRSGMDCKGDGYAKVVAESDGSLSRVPSHTPVGPFTTWETGLRPQEIGDDVDWSALTGIRLECFVRYQPFTGS